MGLLQNLTNRVFGAETNSSDTKKNAFLRKCYFEVMEQRRVLSADPVVAGVTFLEGDEGGDSLPDHFEITFEGGSETTQLSQFVINGDQDLSGTLSNGDVFFDATEGLPGTGESHEFLFDAANSSGITESDIVSATVSDDGLSLTVEIDNFEAGDVLAFTIDVDEVEGLRNDRITSGVEFESSIFTATFDDAHFTFENLDIETETTLLDGFLQTQTEGLFFDEFDDLLAEGESISGGFLDLTRDNEEGLEDRTAGAVDAYELVERPIEISGTVFHDRNLDWVQGSDEEGIADVEIRLQRLNEATNQFEDVAQTTTDANGDYSFGQELGLTPGEYQIIQVQPDGFLDVGATPGTVEGVESGSIQDDASGNENVLTGISIPLGGTAATDFDFKEIRPASIEGNVWHDENNDGVFDPNEDGIANVLIQVTRVGAKDGVTTDPFADTAPIFVRTDANGHYSVDALPPGIYEVVEINNDPEGGNPLGAFIDGQDSTGNVRGETRGTRANDSFGQIVLCADDHGEDYNFGEILPASISGYVSVETPGQGKLDPDDPNFDPISGVTLQLLDDSGNLLATTTTDENGLYRFDGLAPGNYTVVEVQPDGFIDAGDVAGTVDGQTNGLVLANDRISNIELGSGDEGTRYDFCEHRPASIHGTVYHDRNNNGIQEDGEEGIEDVLIQLFDEDGNVVQETRTDASGAYWFTDLVAGIYHIEETQPTEFQDGQDSLGSVDEITRGESAGNDAFYVDLRGGETGVEYNFGEFQAAEIHGRVFADGPAFVTEDGTLPDNFRDQRDAIFTAGVDTPLANVQLQLFFFIDNATQEIAPRAVTLADVDASFYQDLGTNPNTLITTRTDAEGNYWFQGLQPGNYIVVETQPQGFEDSTDVVGSTTGQVFNTTEEAATAQTFLTNTFTTTQLSDAVVNIRVNSGGNSVANNFSEVVVQTLPPPDPSNPQLPVDVRPTPTGNPLTPRPGLTGFPGLSGSQPSAFTQFVGTARGASFQTQATPAEPFSWHLSVVNGGLPRAFGEGDVAGGDSIFQQAGYIDSGDWNRFDMTAGTWTFTETSDNDGVISKTPGTVQFGMIGGTPLAGDFDGDGEDELAIFKDGYWLIDINSNGTWDQTDLLAKLGDSEDRPVVGDWDGDGKDDIGIYGPMWERDQEAIDSEPGLPNPDNDPFTRPKNVPPIVQNATNGARIMKLTSHGQQRTDVVDHVFGVDDGEKIPVTGDWNGNGIRSIGTFEDGVWRMDVNGDGEFDHKDRSARFGRAGDVPLVGDFNGDGVEQIAIYRSGTWFIDDNGNRELDATDKTFQMGGAGDKPVVGDWDGDGIDEPGLYSDGQSSINETF